MPSHNWRTHFHPLSWPNRFHYDCRACLQKMLSEGQGCPMRQLNWFIRHADFLVLSYEQLISMIMLCVAG